MGGYLPVAVLKGRARRRQREFAEVWPEAVDNLASAVRAGMSLPEALAALSERGPEPLREAFAGFALDYQVSGRFADSLDRLKDRLADPVGDRVVESLRVAREVGGGDLGRLLRSLSGFLRDDARTRSELESRQAWTVNGARLAVAAPWLVLLLMCFQPEVIQRYSTGAGVVVLVGGAVLCVVAYRAMVRIGRLPDRAADPLVTPVRRWAARSGARPAVSGWSATAVLDARRTPLAVRVLPYVRDLPRPGHPAGAGRRSSNAFAGVFGPALSGGRPGGRAGARRCGVGTPPPPAGRSRDGRRAVPGRAGDLGTGRVRDRRGAVGAGRGGVARARRCRC